LHRTVALSGLVKDIKLATSDWIKRENVFPNFRGWQDGYSAFTYSIDAKNKLIQYVSNQVEHHKLKSFKEEYRDLLNEHGIEFDDRYLK